MVEGNDMIDRNAQWLRDMRAYLGWSTSETAEYAREAASELQDSIRISQQLVSAFENGKLKSTPRWLGYIQVAMSHYIADRTMDPGKLWQLTLPQTMKTFFDKRRAEIRAMDDAIGSFVEEEMEKLERRASDKRQAFGAFPVQSANDIAAEHGLMPIRQIDLAFGMGATFLDVPVEEETMLFPTVWVRQYTKAPASKLFFAQGVGDSMQPTLAPNDTLIIDCSQERLTMADQIWALSYCGLGMVKRLRPTKDGGIRIMSDNPHIPEEIAYDGELQLIGRVVAVTRKI